MLFVGNFPLLKLIRIKSMKKALLVAASLFTTAAAVTTGAAVQATEQGPSKQFVLTQSTAGNLVFQGVGTAQYNNSIGTNNSFQVGSSTNLGVNASTSSTPEYEVTSHAKLDLSGSSVLKQIIGTSGASQTKTAEQVAAMTYADTTAKDTASTYAETNATSTASESASNAQSSWESSNGGSWANYYGDSGWSSTTHMSEDEWNNASSDAYSNEYDSVYTSTKNSLYDSKYTEAYNNAYTEAASNISTDTNANATNGVIKGTFTTSEFGEAEAGGSAAEWRESASASAETDTAVSFQDDWDAYSLLYGSTGAYATSEEYDTARTEAYSTAYADAYASSMSTSSRTSSSDVEVTGIGSDASVTAAGTSTFDVLISTVDDVLPESTATANGAAGANLSTSSFANQSQASTASAFMQAFGGSQY